MLQAVLLRAGEVIEGAELAARRRAAAAPRRAGACASRVIASRDLARGPARLATSLGIELADSGGMLAAGPLTLEPGPLLPPERVATGPRVGVSGLGGTSDYPWRFWLEVEPTVSTYRPAATAAGVRPAR